MVDFTSKKDTFKFPMRKYEKVLGIIHIPFHAIILPLLLIFILSVFNADISNPYRMLLYYAISFVIVLAVMFRFLRSSFSDLIDGVWQAIQALILAYILYRALLWVGALLLTQFMTEQNPNQDVLVTQVAADFRVMIVVTVLLAPIVEETTFRGALFGTIRQKSRVAAYIVSTVLFCFIHLWDFLVSDFSWATFSALVQYVPASIALAWCYDRSGTIWMPILMHMVINLTGVLQMR